MLKVAHLNDPPQTRPRIKLARRLTQRLPDGKLMLILEKGGLGQALNEDRLPIRQEGESLNEKKREKIRRTMRSNPGDSIRRGNVVRGSDVLRPRGRLRRLLRRSLCHYLVISVAKY